MTLLPMAGDVDNPMLSRSLLFIMSLVLRGGIRIIDCRTAVRMLRIAKSSVSVSVHFGCRSKCCVACTADPTFMARINHIRHPDLAVICLPVALLGNPLLLAAAVGRGIVAAGTLRIAGILLGLGGIALVVRLRGIGRLVILLLGVIGLLVLVVGFFLLLGLGSRGLRRLFFARLLFVFILYRCGGLFRRAASLLCNAGTSKLRCRKAHQKRNDNSLCSHADLPVHETGRWTLADIQRPARFYICSRRFF